MYSSHYDYNKYDTNSDSDSIEEEMLINLYENPINREALAKIPGTNTYINSILLMYLLEDREQEKHTQQLKKSSKFRAIILKHIY